MTHGTLDYISELLYSSTVMQLKYVKFSLGHCPTAVKQRYTRRSLVSCVCFWHKKSDTTQPDHRKVKQEGTNGEPPISGCLSCNNR